MTDTGKGSEAAKKRMAYARSFKKTTKGGKMSPKREVKAASPRRVVRKTTRKSPMRKTTRKSRKSPERKSTERKTPMTMKTF